MSFMAFGPSAGNFMNPANQAVKAGNPLFSTPTQPLPANWLNIPPASTQYANYKNYNFGNPLANLQIPQTPFKLPTPQRINNTALPNQQYNWSAPVLPTMTAKTMNFKK